MAHVLDLLAEVEGALTDTPLPSARPPIAQSTAVSAGAPPRVHAPSGGHNRRVSGRSEVDELLSMLDDEEPGKAAPASLHRVSSTSDTRVSRGSDADTRGCGGVGAPSSSSGNKCASVYLGAASADVGQARATTRK